MYKVYRHPHTPSLYVLPPLLPGYSERVAGPYGA